MALQKPLHPFCTSIINNSMNTVRVKKTSNMQVVEIQITLQDGRLLVNKEYDFIGSMSGEKLAGAVSIPAEQEEIHV